MSTVKVNIGAINRFFERSPLAGAGAPGLRSGSAERIAARMITFVEREIIKDFDLRTGELLGSLRPIIRPDPRGGTRVGVGSTAPHSKYLTEGTPLHVITARDISKLLSSGKSPPGYGLRHPVQFAIHPGNQPNDFIRRGVNLAIGRPLS